MGLVSGTAATDGPLSRVVLPDVEVHSLRVLAPPVSYAYGLEFLARLVARARGISALVTPAVFHGHSGRWDYSLALDLLARRLDRPWVYTVYCPVNLDSFPKRLVGDFTVRALRRAALVTGMSRNVVESLQRAGVPGEKLRHVDPCVDTTRFRSQGRGSEVRKRLEIPPQAPVLLFVGNASHSKGFDIVWAAYRAVKTTVSDAHLVATFEWRGMPDADRALDLCRETERADVRFLGLVEDMPALLDAADVVVVPFRTTDGPSDYPLIILEAMAMGTAVIGTEIGGIPEIIRHGETGLLVPKEDPVRLAEAIIPVVENPRTRVHFVAAGRDLVRARFSPEVAAQTWKEIYDAACER